MGTIAKGIAEGDERVSLFPTPNTMEHREIKTPEQIAELKKKSPGGYRNLREEVVNNLPTPNTMDHLNPREGEALERQLYRGGSESRRNTTGNLREDVIINLPTPRANEPGSTSPGYGDSLNDFASRVTNGYAPKDLLATPVASEGTKAPAQQNSATKKKTGQVWLSNQAKDLEEGQKLLPTTRTSMKNGATQKEIDAGNPKSRIEAVTDWGKYEAAIRRWEEVTGREAPEPTKPDGRDGGHRLSSKFTEWMMGLPDGWITGLELSRNNELKACGNGVVPQQAYMAVSDLLAEIEAERDGNK